MANIELTSAIEIVNQTVTINLNDYTLKSNWVDEEGVVEVLWARGENTEVTINGDGAMISGKGSGTNSVVSATEGAVVNIYGGIFYSEAYGAVIYASTEGIVNIYGGSFEAATAWDEDGKWYVLDINESAATLGTINVYGGAFVNYNPANNNNDGAEYSNKVADGYHSIYDEETSSYIVSKHNYNAVVTAPDCENGGFTTNSCICGNSYVTDETDALGHTTVVDEAVEATCTETGLTEGSHCSVCEEVLVAQEVVEATGHNTVVDKAVEATCTTAGKTEGSHCSVCNEVFVAQQTIDATGHNYEYGICSGCKKAFPALQEIKFEFGENGSAAHVDGNDLGTSKSYTVDGYTLNLTGMSKVYGSAYDAMGNSCIKLGTSSVTAKFSFAVPADVNQVIIYVAGYKANKASVLVNGTTYAISSTSNNGVYTEVIIDTSVTKTISFATNSTPDERAMINTIVFVTGEECAHTPDAEATCTTAQRCTICGATVTAALGHKYDNNCDTTCNECEDVREITHAYNAVVTAPDCLNDGYTTYTCSVCGNSYVADETDALGHTEVIDAAVAPSCEDTGLTEGKHCSVCEAVLTAQETVAALGHSYENGECTTCGQVEGHVHNYTPVVTDPTCTEKGYTTYTCDCGDSYVDDETAVLGHTAEKDSAVAPDCINTGLTEGSHCSVCGVILVAQEEVAATGTHIYDADGNCTGVGCDAAKPSSVTVSKTIYANKGTLANKVITWTGDNFTVSNAQASSTTTIRTSDSDHFRVYAKSELTIAATSGTLTKVVITCTSSSYATVMQTSAKNAGYTATVSGSVVTITVNNEESITFTASAQTRLNKVEVTYTPA